MSENYYEPPVTETENPRRKKADKNDPIRIRREVTAFMIGIGVLLLVGAYFSFTGLERAPDIFGMKRSLFFGGSFAVFGLLHIIPAVIFKITGNRGVLYIAALGNTALAIGSFLLIGLAGVIGALIQIGMPILVWNRTLKVK